jgi:hypothetical protein
MGRSEDVELPVFGLDATRIIRVPKVADQSALPPQDHPAPLSAAFGGMGSNDGFKFRMLNAMRVVTAESAALGGCKTFIPGPVMFVTRVEYANLFHTSTGASVCTGGSVFHFSPPCLVLAMQIGSTHGKSRVFLASRPRWIMLPTRSSALPRTCSSGKPPHLVPVPPACPYMSCFWTVIMLGRWMRGGWHSSCPLTTSSTYLTEYALKTLSSPLMGEFLTVRDVGHCCRGARLGFLSSYRYHAAISQGMQPRGNDCREEPHVLQFGADMVAGLGLVPRTNTACEEVRVHLRGV